MDRCVLGWTGWDIAARKYLRTLTDLTTTVVGLSRNGYSNTTSGLAAPVGVGCGVHRCSNLKTSAGQSLGKSICYECVLRGSGCRAGMRSSKDCSLVGVTWAVPLSLAVAVTPNLGSCSKILRVMYSSHEFSMAWKAGRLLLLGERRC